jgi:hypothetical protein
MAIAERLLGAIKLPLFRPFRIWQIEYHYILQLSADTKVSNIKYSPTAHIPADKTSNSEVMQK